MNELEYTKTVQYKYVVIFHAKSNYIGNYNPIINISNMRDFSYGQTMHIWDDELNGIMPAIWYIMHLPRNAFDTSSCDIELIFHSHDEAHNIIVLPFYDNEDIDNKLSLLIDDVTLIICEDDILSSVQNKYKNVKTSIGLVNISSLTSDLLQEHWKKLATQYHSMEKDTEMCLIDSSFRLMNESERKIIPLIPLANQFGYTNQLVQDIKEITSKHNCNKYMLAMTRRVLEICNADKGLKVRTEKIVRESKLFRQLPMVITFPGTMKYQYNRFNRSDKLTIAENEVIQSLGIHRATAKKAIYLELDCVPQSMYTDLASLEEHCKNSRNINCNYVWRILRKLGKDMTQVLGDNPIDIINHISHIIAFSDFPIGLAILPDCSAPLCCIKPISYRPLTPLTRAFQYEMTKERQVYWGKRIKLIIAECISKNDRIRSMCDGLSVSLKDMAQKENSFEVKVYEISSVSEFKKMLNSNKDADVLLISAHGSYDINSNMAGIVVGDDVWMMNDSDFYIPPVVLLSACHVMPRGRGAVTVGDLALRAGAITVLGTFIPVDVTRNAILIVRLFTEILEVRKGWSEMRTLDEIWCHVVCTNPIHEVIASTTGGISKLEAWANTRRNDGSLPQEEFKMDKSVGRLRCTHAYEDTINILREIAYEDGIGDYFDSYIKSQGYFPESVFYQLIGVPENVFVRNDVFEEVFN